MRTAAWVGFWTLNVACLLYALWANVRWRRCWRALREWRIRWDRAELRCGLCGQPEAHVDHAERDYDEATLRHWGKHRFVPARLVPEIMLLPREGLVRD